MNTQKNMQSQPNTNLRLEQAVIAGLLVSPEAIFDVAGYSRICSATTGPVLSTGRYFR